MKSLRLCLYQRFVLNVCFISVILKTRIFNVLFLMVFDCSSVNECNVNVILKKVGLLLCVCTGSACGE